ncbi:MAG TPA: acyl-CoA dehydrogenase family protein [Steroidobacteraceae bacterium]|nr:acyl-CoA dehydrogenase family protein [Steroidobacteraceae bacterium]
MNDSSVAHSIAAGSASSAATLSERSAAVAAVAARHAAEVDSAPRFPAETFAAVKAQRLLGILVPSSLGGEGASVQQVADVCYRLGQACSSTAMIYAMHQVKVACLVRHGRASEAIERLLRRLCAEQLLLASSTTEGQRGGDVRSSEAAVEHRDGRIHLERRATVISYGSQADGVVTTARRAADADSSDQVLIAFLKDDYTLTRLQGWNTLGMRGTCSEGYTLKASGSPGQVLPEPYAGIHSQTMVPFAHLLWGSVWAGIAAGATARAQAFVRHAARQAGGQAPPGAPQLTQAQSKLRTLRGVLANSLRAYESRMDDPKALGALDFQSQITLTKVEVSELAVATVLTALRVCGLSGYRCDSEFSVERQLRDVLSSPLMINNDRILASLAGTSLLAAVPTSLSD